MLLADGDVIPPGWTNVLTFGALGVAGLIAVVVAVFFLFGGGQNKLSGQGLAFAIVAFGSMVAIAVISFLTQKQPDPSSEDRHTLRTLCSEVTGKLATVHDNTARSLAEQMRRDIDQRVPCPKQDVAPIPTTTTRTLTPTPSPTPS